MTKQDNLQNIDSILQRLVQEKTVKVETDPSGTDLYSMTKKGIRQIETKLRKDETSQLYLFTMIFNLEKEKVSDPYERMLDAIKAVQKYNPHFLTVLTNAVKNGDIKGLTLKESS